MARRGGERGKVVYQRTGCGLPHRDVPISTAMRRLYVIPIIHMSADMGSMALPLEKAASTALQPGLWQKHKATIADFWDSIGRFVDSLDVRGFKVYQDGLVADGADGLRIIREGISQGSRNYEIVGGLLEKGAILVKTEDLLLVKREYGYIEGIARSRSWKERGAAALRYRLAREKLLKQRDEFIARRIDESLGEGETGILFIGAYHSIVPNLPSDIAVVQAKEATKVREYHKALITRGKYAQYLQRLADYLVSPVSVR